MFSTLNCCHYLVHTSFDALRFIMLEAFIKGELANINKNIVTHLQIVVKSSSSDIIRIEGINNIVRFPSYFKTSMLTACQNRIPAYDFDNSSSNKVQIPKEKNQKKKKPVYSTTQI